MKLLVCKSLCHVGVTLEVSPWSQLMWSSFVTRRAVYDNEPLVYFHNPRLAPEFQICT